MDSLDDLAKRYDPIEYFACYDDQMNVDTFIGEMYAEAFALGEDEFLSDEAIGSIEFGLRLVLTNKDRAAVLRAAPKRRGHWVTECMHLLRDSPVDARRIYNTVKTFTTGKTHLGTERLPKDGSLFLDVILRYHSAEHAAIVSACAICATDSAVFEEFEETARWVELLRNSVISSEKCAVIQYPCLSQVDRATGIRIHSLIKLVESGFSCSGVLLQEIRSVKHAKFVEMPKDVSDAINSQCLGSLAPPGKIVTRSRACVTQVDLTGDCGTVRKVWIRSMYLTLLEQLFNSEKSVKMR
jgi:hypothetical protein